MVIINYSYTLAIQHAYLRIRLLFNNDKKLLEKYTLTFCYLISGVVPAPFDPRLLGE